MSPSGVGTSFTSRSSSVFCLHLCRPRVTRGPQTRRRRLRRPLHGRRIKRRPRRSFPRMRLPSRRPRQSSPLMRSPPVPNPLVSRPISCLLFFVGRPPLRGLGYGLEIEVRSVVPLIFFLDILQSS